MKVRDYMTSTVLVVQATDPAREALENMALGDVRHLPVVDADGRLEGVVSDRDLRLPDWAQGIASADVVEAALKGLTVADVMTRFAVTVRPEADLLEAAHIFVDLRFGVVPVVDEAGELQGMLSAMDVLRAFLDEARPD
ncbi:MAG: CBS domain-containing protein [bacterium]